MTFRSIARPALAACGALVLALGAALAAGASQANDRLTIALDWVPNTNHTGIYVAQARDYFRDQGIDLRILPYSGASTDVLVANGKADLGVSFVPSLLLSRTSGLKIKAVGAIMSRNTEAVVTMADSDIRRPRDISADDTYGGFGLPYEVPLLNAIIRADGGNNPQFKTATLNTAAYEALYAKKVSFSALFLAWEAIEARQRKPPVRLRLFPFTKYLGEAGNFPSVIFVASDKGLAERRDVLQRGMKALSDGYTFAARQPGQAANILIAADKALQKTPALVNASAKYLAPIYLRNGRWGYMRGSQISGIGRILLNGKALTGPNKRPVTSVNFNQYFTNALLPGAS
jgi:ABC-type nitrate/sulfonate/bicarbonate transport system substrate-binding protein